MLAVRAESVVLEDPSLMDVQSLPMRDRLICALDMADVEEAKRVINELDGVVSFFKIGITLHLASGLEIVKLLLDSGKRVFLDLKYYDVPATVGLAVAEAARQGISFLTIHGNHEIIAAAAKAKGDSDLKLLSVTFLTSLDQSDLSDLGIDLPVEDYVLLRAKSALKWGCDGVISSAREAAKIKEETNNELMVVTPGIRDGEPGEDDQKRTMPADKAIEAGADFLVVGRPITGKADRRAAAERIVRQMEAGQAALQEALQ